jgi:hypothetical protein
MKSKLELEKEFEAMIASVEDTANDLVTRKSAMSVLKNFVITTETSDDYTPEESVAVYAIVGELEDRFLELKPKS